MALSENTKDILSFGAHGRVQNKLAEYEAVRADWANAQQLLNEFAESVNAALADLLVVRKNAVASLRQIRQLAQHFSVRDRDLSELQIATQIEITLQHVEATLTGAEIAESTLQGVSAGASAVLGVWALSAATGGALTSGATAGLLTGLGVAPVALTGVTAGSVVGGGALAGAAVVGSLAVIPATAAVALVSHFKAGKKIKEIEAAIAQIQIETEKIRGRQILLTNLQQRAAEIGMTTLKTQEAFTVELRSSLKRIFPWRFLSRCFKTLRRYLGGNYFSRRDVEAIAPLLQIAEMLAKLIDQKILDADGKVH